MSKDPRPVMDDWVYAERQLRDSFDADLLEKHARAQLARSLTTGRLIAVVGSGVSSGYGQPSWHDLLLSTVEMVEARLAAADKTIEVYFRLARSRAAGDVVLAADLAQARRAAGDIAPIIDAFLSFNLRRGAKGPDVDRMPIAFEVCENLYAALVTRIEAAKDGGASARSAGRMARRELRDRLKWQLKDDRGRMELLLSRLIQERFAGDAALRKTLEAIQQVVVFAPAPSSSPPEVRDGVAAWLSHLLYRSTPRKGSLYAPKGTRSAAEEAADRQRAFRAVDDVTDGVELIAPRLKALRAAPAKDGGSGGRPGRAASMATRIAVWLTRTRSDGPDARHLIDASFELLDGAEIVAVLNGLHLSALACFAKDPTGKGMLGTRALTPRQRDPFAVIIDELKIKRILTTNYDGELDRLLESRGFSPLSAARDEVAHPIPEAQSAPSRTLLIDPSSIRAEILAYEPGAAAFLFDYGADTREHRTQVLHIHGRVGSPESWLVLSERDYRERYARDDDPKARADDAMRLIFTANPLLFLGLGMKEPDILRPLRAFSADVSRLCDRPAVALLPRDKLSADLQDSQLDALSRYGVYNLYYGEAGVLARRRNIGVTRDPDFMAKLLSFQAAAWKRLNQGAPYIWDTRFEPVLSRAATVEIEGSRSGAVALRLIRSQILLIHEVLAADAATPVDARVLAALKVLNQGVGSVTRTTFLTAWLRRMVGEWSAWRQDWSAAPNRREPEGRSGEVVLNHVEASRHRNLLRNLELEAAIEQGRPLKAADRARAPSTDRFFAGAPSPAFQVLRAATRGAVASPQKGRRIFYLLSKRGTGRGHVFSAMRSPRRFAHLCDWLGLTEEAISPLGQEPLPNDEACQEHTANVDSAFFNMGLSHEVISTFDRLAYFLEWIGERATPERRAASSRADQDGLRGDRVGRIRNALARLHALGQAQTGRAIPPGGLRRAVVVINHISVLFERDGRPKNAQVRRLFEALVDPRFDQAPVDFIFMMNEEQLPTTLRQAGLPDGDTDAKDPHWRSPQLRLLKPQNLPTALERMLEDRIRASFGPAARLAAFDPDAPAASPPDPRVYVHFLHYMRPVTLATRFFPRTAAALAFLDKPGRRGSIVQFGAEPTPKPPGQPRDYFTRDVVEWLGFETEVEVRDFQSRVRQAFETRLSDVDGDREIARLGAAFAGDAIEDIMLEALQAYRPQQAEPGAALDQADQAIQQGMVVMLQPGAEGSAPRRPTYFDAVASAVGRSRYAMTVVLAAVDDMIARRLPEKPRNLVDLAPIDGFLQRLKLNTAGKAPGVREDIAIAHVLLLYKTDAVSTMGHPLRAWPYAPEANEPPDSVWARLYDAKFPMLFDLQERILVTLALIGQPVEAAVLTGVATVAEALQNLTVELGFDTPESQAECLRRVLDLLVHRCLVFRLAAKGPEDDPTAPLRQRFATHKSMRRHLYRQFNAPIIDYSEVDQLTVSLYATQPSDLPRPTAEGHRRVRHLIEQLSLFEKSEGERGHARQDPFLDALASLAPEAGETERLRIARARLRAAYGALRSIYSIGVVSRFSSYEDEGVDTPENGYFEHHRMRVRWMLRMANRLDGLWERGCDAAADDTVHTFHAEEIVWLFNECGVLSLAQGRMNDASALLSQASRVARDFVEASGWGALHARIGVNRAIADIQRGRLRDAEAVFSRVAAEGEEEHEALVLIAKGYLALLRDLRGDGDSAAEAYGPIIEALARIGRFRSAAIFSIQYADCLRGFGPARADEAACLAESGCRYAAQGGHEDIRQIGQLAKCWVEIVRGRGAIQAQDKRRIEDKLDEIAAYARMMGMPRLTCSVALARGQFYLDQGDYRMAAELAQEALRLATRFDIELRKIGALSLLGSAMLRLNMPQARSLLMRARDLAYHADNTAAVGPIEAELGLMIDQR